MKERLLDLVFLVGVVFKGIDGTVELLGGAVLVFVRPERLIHYFHLGSNDVRLLALYLVLHGVVKVAIVGALLVGSRRVYPWAIAALFAFLVYQAYLLVTGPSLSVVALTVFDAFIIWLTWREWRHGRTLHDTARSTFAWLLRRSGSGGTAG